MEHGSQWREVIWRLKFLPESGRKVAGKHHNRAGRGAVAVGREKEERERALNYLVQMSLRQNKYMAEISSPKVTMVQRKPWLIS